MTRVRRRPHARGNTPAANRAPLTRAVNDYGKLIGQIAELQERQGELLAKITEAMEKDGLTRWPGMAFEAVREEVIGNAKNITTPEDLWKALKGDQKDFFACVNVNRGSLANVLDDKSIKKITKYVPGTSKGIVTKIVPRKTKSK